LNSAIRVVFIVSRDIYFKKSYYHIFYYIKLCSII